MRRRLLAFDDSLILILGLSLFLTYFFIQRTQTYESSLTFTQTTALKLTEDLQARDQAIRDRDKTLEARTQEINDLKKTLAKEKAERESLQGDLKKITGDKSSLEQNLNRRLQEKTTELGKLSETNEQLNQTVRALVEEAERQKKDLNALQDEIQSKDLIIARLTGEKTQAESRLKDLEAAVPPSREQQSRFFSQLSPTVGSNPGVQVSGQSVIIESATLFEEGGTVSENGKTLLNRILQQYRILPKETSRPVMIVDVHTVARAVTDPLNPPLSPVQAGERQAAALRQEIERLGFTQGQILIRSLADTQPIDTRQDEFAQRRNQRVEVRLVYFE